MNDSEVARLLPPKEKIVNDADDAARWRYVRDHGFLTMGEDDDLALCLWLMDDFSVEETPQLTREERRNLLGKGAGDLPRGDALTRAVDAARKERP